MTNINEYVPIYIQQIIAAAPKKTITAERWNELWNLVITQGDYNSEALLAMADAILALTHQGEYNPATAYLRLSVVSYQNSSYMAKQNTTGNLPTNATFWGMIAEKGDSAYQVWLDQGNIGTEADFLNDLLASKVAELDAHYVVKAGELDVYTGTKETQLDAHTVTKETQLNAHTVVKEGQLDAHTVVKQGALDTHTTAKEVQLNAHTTTKETQLDVYTGTKETQLNAHTLVKEGELDAHTVLKKAELDAHTTSLTLDLDDLEDRVAVFEVYNPLTAYRPLNKVTSEGNSYVCIANTTGNTPPNATYWLLIAQKGLDGEGTGDMLKTTYDTNNSGVVDNAEKLGGELPAYYAPASHLADIATLENLAHVKHGTLTATIPSASWTGSSAPFSKAVTVTGLLATDNPIIDTVLTGTYATDQDILTGWGNVYRIVTADNSITVYSKVVPTVDISIQLKVVR